MTKFITFTLALLPFFAAAQFSKVANEICEAGTKAFVIIGDHDLSKTIFEQPELKSVKVYQFDFASEFGRRVRAIEPTMYLFDKNMMAIAQEQVSRSGWRRMKEKFNKRTSKDCLLLVEAVEAAPDGDLVERPSEEELGEFKIELPEAEKPEPKPEKETKPVAVSPGKTSPPLVIAKTKATPKPEEINEDAPHGLQPQRFYTIQIGAYASEANAKKKVAQNPDLYPTYRLEPFGNRNLYVVNFGTFTNRDTAAEIAAKYKGFVKELAVK